jgi:hypothetical protein
MGERFDDDIGGVDHRLDVKERTVLRRKRQSIHREYPAMSVILSVALLCVLHPAHADHFAGAHYDAQADELVVSLHYLGTNPDHEFTVKWGKCRSLASNPEVAQLSGVLADSQWNDAARDPYTKTVRIGLAGMPCRPAQVTLRSAPRYTLTISVPAAPSRTP